MSDHGFKCESPKWMPTKRGRRCGRICVDERGRKRFRFVSGLECGGKPRTKPEEVTEFSATSDLVGAMSEALGVPLKPLEPMPLVPLVGPTGGVEKRRSRK